MTDPTDLLEALLNAPKETSHLLHEQGDPRSDYAHEQLALRTTNDRPAVVARLRQLYPLDHPVWVGRMVWPLTEEEQAYLDHLERAASST